MSLVQSLQRIQKAVNDQKTDFQTVSKQFSNFKRFSKQQLAANQNILRSKIQKIIPRLLDNVYSQKQRLSIDSTNQIAMALKIFKQSLPGSFNIFNKRLMTDLSSATRELLKSNEIKTKIIAQQSKQMNLSDHLIKQIASKPTNIESLNIKTQNYKKFATIQGLVQPIQNILKIKTPTAITPNNVPSTISYLNNYAVSQGYKQMGPVNNSPGRTYIGRVQVQDGLKQYYIPYPKNQILSGQTPNILNNFKFYAGKTINAWNDYVQAENKLVQYVQKIQTPTKRKQFIEQQMKSMTIATFCAQILATLTYYYFFIPLQNFMKFNHKQYDGKQQSFFNNYAVANLISKNPLLLGSKQGKWIAQFLIKARKGDQSKPQNIWNQMKQSNEFKRMKNAMNRLNFQTLQSYLSQKTSEAKTFFTSMGIQAQTYIAILKSDTIYGIKTRKFVIPSMYSNPQILEIIDKISKNQQNEEKTWNMNWGSDKLMCHDYIWSYQI